MTWPAARIAAQESSRIGQAVALRIGRQLSGAGINAGSILAASDPALGPDLTLDAASLTGTGTTLSPRSWERGAGAWSVVVVLPAVMDAGRAQDIAARLRRGALVEVLVSAGAADIGGYLRFGLGVLSAVTSTGPRVLTLEVYDLLYALRSRPYASLDGSGLPQTRLFHDLAGTETTTASNWINGSSTSLTLTNAAGFETIGGTGALRIEDNDGAVIYLTFTGKSGNTLTGVSTTAQLGTTSSKNAASGNTAISSVYFDDHPLIIALQLLCSTGTGSNGVYDVYPVQSGFAIDQGWIDLERIRSVKREILTPETGAYDWRFAIDDPVPDGLVWLSSLLSESGIGLCTRQGQIAAWAAQSLASYDLPSFTITDDMIDGYVDVHWYDPACKFSYNRVQIDSAANSAESILPVTVLPARDEIIYNLADQIRDNEIKVRTMLAGLLADWCHYPPEVVRLTLRGALHGLAEGDVGTLTTARARGRLVSTSDGYSARAAMITEYHADPISGRTQITLMITPSSPSDDYAAN